MTITVKRKIRVLHTLGWTSSGGVEQRRLLMARYLNREKYEHIIVCQEASGVLPGLLRAEGWNLHEIGLAPSILSPAWHAKAARIAQQYKPDIVHGAVFEGVALANSIGVRLPGVPVISEETSDPVNRSWRGNLLMRAMCLRSSAVIGVSPQVGAYLRDRAGIPPRKIRVINNAVLPAPVVTEREKALLRGEYGLADGDVVLGSVGRVRDGLKRFSDLIRALSLLQERWPRLKLLIVGGGPDLPVLRSLAIDLGVGNAVIFAGYQGDARKFYPLMDLFALASAHEAFGLVLVEAMLAGVPVMATAVGGVPYVLDEGRAGHLVPPGCPEAIARAADDLLGNHDKRRALGDAGMKRAEREFSAERYCREIDMLYSSLLA